MKKVSLLLSFLLWGAVLVNAQDTRPFREPNVWVDFQIAESFGLNNWNRVKFASDRLPHTSFSTDLRLTLNISVIRKKAGIFHDIGLGLMAAPRDGFSDPAAQAALATGIPFYTKEMTVEDGYETVNAHFKMTFGFFGKISVGDRFSISPRIGIGFMTIAAPTCEAVLKQQDTNMQYMARYQWFGQNRDDNRIASLGYLAYRLQFAYRCSPKLSLLFGVEYTWHFTRADFSETYTNYFNYNITKTIEHKGNQLNMAGVSLGIAF